MKVTKLLSALLKCLLLIEAVCWASGCTRKIYVPVVNTQKDTLTHRQFYTDTTYTRDSIYVEQTPEIKVKEVYRWKERIRTRTDTLYHTRVDTVTVIKEQPEFKTPNHTGGINKKISDWFKKSGVFLSGGILGIIIITLIRFKRKSRTSS
ncbi:MAG: hypothetical protein HDS87_02920 [Bacteroidales bacterium]|nr:hypothetical protein [Bacteroidales bacterium]